MTSQVVNNSPETTCIAHSYDGRNNATLFVQTVLSSNIVGELGKHSPIHGDELEDTHMVETYPQIPKVILPASSSMLWNGKNIGLCLNSIDSHPFYLRFYRVGTRQPSHTEI